MEHPIEMDYNAMKLLVINEILKISKVDQINNIEVKKGILPLLQIQKKAINKKLHPYELLKKNGYIKNLI
ncbi:hypothetical protein CD31_18985 [Lysinibacillus boronitolerans JCM 21713 = 10a = NBRC 103108]|uniref:Uncharacterized protein n=1 Tax=Lysinibacillus boronitolerans JCM 21713 = 10a = NBRC 103108 TaxID=1294264 RepID=A0ABR4XXN6_9BACI|nr:hypothetical protein CD31_18985 [Lysinibacillus boronitolerans JCM 21713 = 10a = NBRC 103108]